VKKEVGLWIDHRKAVIVSIENEVEEIQEIASNMEKRIRYSSGSRSNSLNSSQGSTSEDMRDRKFDNHLNQFYKEIISMIRDADSIWIFGPGEAKGELLNSLKNEGLEGLVVGIETEDKMTDNQIAAKIRDHYLV
jgi:hypothetical protein